MLSSFASIPDRFDYHRTNDGQRGGDELFRQFLWKPRMRIRFASRSGRMAASAGEMLLRKGACGAFLCSPRGRTERVERT